MRRNAGFTIVELVVALAIAGLVMLGAGRLLGGVLDATPRLAAERSLLDRESNGVRALEDLVGSMDMTSPGAQPFDGRPDQVSFTTWSSRPSGWPEFQRLTLRVSDGQLVADLDAGSLILIGDVKRLAVDYLLNSGANEKWASRWLSPTSPPAALRLRIERTTSTDTLLLLVGPRG